MPARSAPCWRRGPLSSSGNSAAIKLAVAYSNIANSIPEAIKVSRRIAADQLDIPLNGEFNRLLAIVRGNNAIKLKHGSKLSSEEREPPSGKAVERADQDVNCDSLYRHV